MKNYKYERDFQSDLIRIIKNRFPDCEVIKNDSGYRQGIPDLMILYNNHWAALEVKIREDAQHQPNQDWYVDKWNKMSFAAFIFPDNMEEVLNEMERSFES